MAFWSRARPVPETLTASVATVPHNKQISVLNIGRRRSRDDAWQKDAWAYFKMLGEVRFAARFVGNAVGRAHYYVGTRERPGDPVVPIPDGADPDDLKMRDSLSRIKGRDGTLASLLAVYGVQQFVTGESFLVAEDGLEGEQWEILSTSELRRLGKNQIGLNNTTIVTDQTAEYVKLYPDGTEVIIGPNSLVLRMWTRDPEWRERADSPMRPVLNICEALHTAQAMQTAGDRSRLASTGLFLIPAEADLPKAPTTDNAGGPRQPGRLMLMDETLEAMTTAMNNPGSAAAIAPIMLEVKSDLIEKFKRITFEREVDKTIVARIDHLIRRFAMGVDLPPEILLGLGDVNHWTGYFVSEEAVNAHIKPVALGFAGDMTVGFVKPTALALKVANPDKYAIGVDVTELVVAPNRADHAFMLYDRYLLSGNHLLYAIGFNPIEQPDMNELIRRIEVARAINPRNPNPGADIAALLGKNPPPTGAERPVIGVPPNEQPPLDAPVGVPPTHQESPSGQPNPTRAPADTKEGKDKNQRGIPAGGVPSKPTSKAGSPKIGTGKGAGRKGERGQQKTAIIDRMVAAADEALCAAVTLTAATIEELDPDLDLLTMTQADISSLGFTNETLFAGSWEPLRVVLLGLSGCEACVDAIIEGLDEAARKKLFNPAIDLNMTARLFCEAAMFDPETEDPAILTHLGS